MIYTQLLVLTFISESILFYNKSLGGLIHWAWFQKQVAYITAKN